MRTAAVVVELEYQMHPAYGSGSVPVMDMRSSRNGTARGLLARTAGTTQLFSRNANNLSTSLPELTEACSAVLEGRAAESVVGR